MLNVLANQLYLIKSHLLHRSLGLLHILTFALQNYSCLKLFLNKAQSYFNYSFVQCLHFGQLIILNSCKIFKV